MISGILYIFMNMLIMLIKLSAQRNELWSQSLKYVNFANQVISPGHFFIGFGQTVQLYFKNWFGMESSNTVEKLSVGQWIQKLNVMLC